MSEVLAPGLRGSHLHFECAAGIAGDMTVGALVDLGVPEAVVLEALAALPLRGYRAGWSRVRRGALVGSRFLVEIEGQHAPAHPPAADHHHGDGPAHAHHHHGHHAHRHYADIRAMLVAAPLAPSVRERAIAIFDGIARVEARLHGVEVGEVAFHEVGAVDSIVDIVATAAALDWLAPASVTCRAVALGHGTVATAHGLLPVPSPAALELLVGAPVEDGGVEAELTTPTGAAILAASVTRWSAMPAVEIVAVGWGAGERELPDRPNLLRVVAGRPVEAPAGEGTRLVVIEANVDDTTPELLAPLISDLLTAGARDAWVTPVTMKKGRPGWVASALCDAHRVDEVERALFRGSTTIGVRRHPVERTVLARRIVEVQTPYGAVQVKVAGEGEAETAQPEYEDCARLAREHGVPVRRIHAEAVAAFHRSG